MIRQPTVLILGAGASQPYNFPSGQGLVDQISTEINHPSSKGDVAQRLAAAGYDLGILNHFVNELRRARPNSVDAFLETRKEFREIGKAVIAEALLRAEAHSTVHTANPTVDWYRYVLHILMQRSPDRFVAQAHRLTVVTFNFDRSLERVLFERAKGQFGGSDEEATRLVTELQIHHVHGMLGEPSWFTGAAGGGTAYGGTADFRATIGQAVKQIKIVDEEIDQAMLDDIGAALMKTTYVYFIGFGFDERNLQKLGPPDYYKKTVAIKGTALHMTAHEQAPALRYFRPIRDLALFPKDALTFIREHAEAFHE